MLQILQIEKESEECTSWDVLQMNFAMENFTFYSSRINCFNGSITSEGKRKTGWRDRREKAFSLVSAVARFASTFICRSQENSSSFARETEYKEENSICEMYPVIIRYVVKHVPPYCGIVES